MSSVIHLDPEKMAPLEPSEGDALHGSRISPFDVPLSIFLGFEPAGGIAAARFEYPGGEKGEKVELVDPDPNPSVRVKTAYYSGKILELTFHPPVGFDDFRAIALRLTRSSQKFPAQSKKFSFRMIAQILAHWDQFTSESR